MENAAALFVQMIFDSDERMRAQLKEKPPPTRRRPPNFSGLVSGHARDDQKPPRILTRAQARIAEAIRYTFTGANLRACFRAWATSATILVHVLP